MMENQDDRQIAASAARQQQVDQRLAAVAVEDAGILRTEGQRWTNKFWEKVQGGIALSVTVTAMLVVLILTWREEYERALQLLAPTLFTILGFYFSRTNHQTTGGVKDREVGR